MEHRIDEQIAQFTLFALETTLRPVTFDQARQPPEDDRRVEMHLVAAIDFASHIELAKGSSKGSARIFKEAKQR